MELTRSIIGYSKHEKIINEVIREKLKIVNRKKNI